ncbi:WhiB family transcriptional regulator [Nonomuraea wenchangensis]
MAVDWREKGACRDLDPDLFFSGGPPLREAREACSRCTVFITCFFDALRVTGHGYQAGMSRLDRARIRAWDRKQRAHARVAP